MKPRIRLSGYKEEWNGIRFENLFTLINDANSNVASKDYLSSGQYPIIDQSQDFIIGYTNKSTPLIPSDGYIIFGDHTRVVKYVDFPFYTGADGTKVLSVKEKNEFSPLFMYYLCSSLAIPNTGYNRHYKYLKEFTFIIPSISEQRDIAAFLKSLDSLITASTSRLTSLKQTKEASLQAMFPQEGETIPRLRFKGFEGEWKDYPLSDICNKNISSLSENSLGPNEGKYAVYGASGYIQQIPTYDMNAPYVGIIKDGSGVGRSQLYPAYSSLLGTMQYITPKDGFSIEFFASLFQTINFSSYINGSSIPHIYYKDYCNLIILAPSFEEQKSIGSYFTNLNCQISLLSQRLERLKQIKSACLDNMFV